MAVDSISGAAASASSLTSSRKTIADNFDTFLSLLTTQLRNQNPLDPLDTNQFTQQLVQFTSVEQQLKTNEFLEALVLGNQNAESNKANLATQAVNLIGKTVVAESVKTTLSGGEANWTYTIGKDAPEASITIRNEAGEVVFEDKGSLTAGQGTFTWDGRDQSGLTRPDGIYTITIVAREANGSQIPVLTQVQGVVDRVDLTNAEPILSVGSSRISLSGIMSVTAG